MKIEAVNNYVAEHSESPKYSESLKGLLSSHIGMVIARPSIGKSHLALSIAIEHASSIELIGLSASKQPQRTLYVSCEDVSDIVAKRLQEKISDLNLSPEQEADLGEYLSVASEELEPLVIPPDSTMADKLEHELYLEKVADAFSGYSLVIIDTISRAAPTCDLVAHDRHITNVFDKLAKKSGASILLIHHVTKSHVHNRDGNMLSMASGLGLSSLMGYSRFIYGIEEIKKQIVLSPLKLNYVQDPQPIHLGRFNSLTTAINSNGETLLDMVPTYSDKVQRSDDSDVLEHEQQITQDSDETEVQQAQPSTKVEKSKKTRGLTRQEKMIQEPQHIVMSTSSKPQKSDFAKFKGTL